MNRNDPVVPHLFGGGHGGRQLGGVVGVIVHHRRTVAFALDLKPPPRATELRCGALGVLGLQSQRPHAAAHGQRIINVVPPRNAQPDMGKGLPQLQHIKLIESRAVFLNVHRAEPGVLLDAEGKHRPVNGVHHIQRVAVIHVEHHRAGEQRELLERHLQPAHGAVVFQMIVVNVQDDAQKRRQMQKSLAVLAGLNHGAAALAGLAVAADQRQLAADHRSRVLPGQFQHGGNHAGGGGFAVGACHADALAVQPAHITQHDAALHRRDAPGAGGVQLGIAIVDGSAVYHQLGIPQVGRVVAHVDLNAEGALRLRDFGFLHIAARDGQPAGMKDLNQRVGPRPAAADKMHMLHPVQQMGVVGCEKCHNRSPQKGAARGVRFRPGICTKEFAGYLLPL